MRLLHSAPIQGTQFLYPEIEADLYSGFLVRLTGTQAAGAFMSLGEVGKVNFSLGGRPQVRCDFDLLHFLGEKKGGDMEATGEANGAAFAYSAFIPRFWGDQNIELVKKSQKGQISIEWGPNAIAGIVSGTVEIYGISERIGVQNYRLQILQYDFIYSGAGSPREPIPLENVIALFMDRAGTGSNNAGTKAAGYAASANFLKAHIHRDGKEVTFNASVGALQAFSNMVNRIESSYTRLFEVDIAKGKIEDTLSDNVGISFEVGGAITIRVLVVAADFTPDERAETKAASTTVFNAIASRKAADGRTRPLRVLQQIAAE